MRWKSRLWRLNRATHRDVGYFTSTLVIAYCLSGVALNHVDDWNPDFQIDKRTISIPAHLAQEPVTPARVTALSRLVGEPRYRIYDAPTPGHLKVYYEDSTLHVRMAERSAVYERVSRRPIFYEVNVLHRNSFKPWKWGADLFAVALILIALTGLFVLRGKNGVTARGKWLMVAGALPPVLVLVLHG